MASFPLNPSGMSSGAAGGSGGGSGRPSGSAGGDLSGSYPNPTVARLAGIIATAYARVASPVFTGNPMGVTQSNGDNSTSLATTAFVQAAVTGGGGGGPTGMSVVTNAAFSGGAKCDAQSVSDGAMTSAGHGLACTTSTPFASGDVGKLIKVKGAGNAGGTLDLITTIATFVDSGHITTTAAAAKTVSGATIFWGTDDTAAFQAAINGGGHVKSPGGVATCITSLTPANNCTLDLTGTFVYQIETLGRSSIAPSTGILNPDPTPQISKFTVLGGIFTGTGNETQNQGCAELGNIVDLTIRGTMVLGYQAYSFYISDCQRVRLEDTTTITTGNPIGAVNYINIAYPLNGTPSNVVREIWATGNYVSAPNAAVSAICITGQDNASSNSAFPIRATITGNNLETGGFYTIALESGGPSGTTFYIQRATITGNICYQDSTSSGCYGIRTTDDGILHSADPALHQDIVIAGNVILSNSGGIGSQANRCQIYGNIIRLANASNPTAAILCQDHNASGIAANNVHDNIISLADGQTGPAVLFLNMHRSQAHNNDISYDTGATGGVDTISFSGCTDCTSRDNTLRNLPGRAVRLSGCAGGMVEGDHVHNPCTASGNAAIFIDGASSGSIVVRNTHCFDDRGGSAKMTFALNNASTGATCYYANPTQIGAVTGLTSGAWISLSAGSIATQTGLVRTAVNYTLAVTDLGAIVTVPGVVVTLPSGLTSSAQAFSYVVKNGSSGAISVSTGTTGKIDNLAGGIAATTDSIPGGTAIAAVYVPDTNLTDWIKA